MATTIRFTPILPKRHNYPLDAADRLEREIAGALTGGIRRSLERSFEARVSGWEKRPSFKATLNRKTRKGGLTGFSLTVAPFGRHKRIWIFVSAGVPQHTILPRKRRRLFVRGGVGGYSARTGPNNRYGGSGSYDEGASFYALRVRHPGIKARTFETYIAKENATYVVLELTKAITRALSL